MDNISIEINYPGKHNPNSFSIKTSKLDDSKIRPRDIIFTSMRVFIDLLIKCEVSKDEDEAKAYLQYAVANSVCKLNESIGEK